MQKLRGLRKARTALTDAYIVLLLSGFLLFPGFSGYLDITFSKYVFFLTATGAWLLGAALLSLPLTHPVGERSRPLLRRITPRRAAVLLLGVLILSWLRSPWRWDAFLGASRWDGLLTWAGYLLVFLGVSRFTRPKRLHASALALALTLCCAVGVLQILGMNPLHLYPGDYRYQDSGTLYSGVYLGTVGNTNLLDAVLCAALPALLGLWLRDGDRIGLLPLPFAAFVLASAGGSGAAAALGACALAVLPWVVTRPAALRRGLRATPLLLLPGAAALAWRPDYVERQLIPRAVISPLPVLLAAAGLAALLLSVLPPLSREGERPERVLSPQGLLPLGYAAGILAALGLLWFWPGGSGTLYELHETLHGRAADSFGSSRVLIWRQCLALVPEYPLLGGGPGTLALRLNIEFSRYVPETGRTLTAFVDNAHNIYLGCLVNCGALSLAAYLLLLALALRRGGSGPLRAGIFCACVHGFFGLGLVLSEPVFWVLLGLLCREDTEKSMEYL